MGLVPNSLDLSQLAAVGKESGGGSSPALQSLSRCGEFCGNGITIGKTEIFNYNRDHRPLALLRLIIRNVDVAQVDVKLELGLGSFGVSGSVTRGPRQFFFKSRFETRTNEVSASARNIYQAGSAVGGYPVTPLRPWAGELSVVIMVSFVGFYEQRFFSVRRALATRQ